MANYWLHNGFLQVEGRKMAKSEGNFVTIHELLRTEKFGGRKWPGEVLRLAMLMTHYREPIDFSVKRLEEAENVLAKLRRKADNVAAGIAGSSLVDALSDDLDLPQYIRLLSANDLPEAELVAAAALIGVDLAAIETDIDVENFVERRLALIREKNWSEADRIRDELLAQGIQLKDGKDPATGERVTTWEVKR
jgi:cysteinyl-tRNA synthetase